MRKAGCFLIYYGIESGSQRILNFIKKGIKIEQIKRAIRWTRETGIKTLGSFIIGFPNETKEEIKKTIEFPKKLKLDYVQFSIATPYPGTELYRIAKEKRLLLTEDWSQYTAAKPVMAMENMEIKELRRLFRRAYMNFYLSPKTLLCNLTRYILPVLKAAARSTLKAAISYIKK